MGPISEPSASGHVFGRAGCHPDGVEVPPPTLHAKHNTPGDDIEGANRRHSSRKKSAGTDRQPKIEVEQSGVCVTETRGTNRTHCESSGSTQAERSRSIWRSTTVLGDEPQWSTGPAERAEEPSSPGVCRAVRSFEKRLHTRPSNPEIPRHFVARRASKVSVRAGDVVMPRAGLSLSG
jgi:hypothetical protein